MTSISALLAVPAAAAPAAAGLLDAFCHVRQQRHLAGPLPGRRDLHLMPAAGARDAPRADLPLLGDVPPQLARVLVVDLVDLVLAEEAVPARDLTCRPARALPRLCARSLACHLSPRTGCRRP